MEYCKTMSEQHSNTPPLHHPTPVVWSIAGTDPTAGAGIQADLKTFQGLGVYGCTIITAVIAQNTMGVQRVEYPSHEIIAAQLESVLQDTPPSAIKIGMLGRGDVIRLAAQACARANVPVICDPVVASSGGIALLDTSALDLLRTELLPQVTVLTPNLPEAERLTNMEIKSPADLEWAASRLLDFGAKSVLIKGGHGDGRLSQDYWTNGSEQAWLACPRLETRHTHGGGCTLSSAIAAAVALGFPIQDALVIAKAYVQQGLRCSPPIGKGRGPLAHLGWPDHPSDLPRLSSVSIESLEGSSFPDPGRLGLYPIVDRADWVQRLAELGVEMIQLRAKDIFNSELEHEVTRAIQIARKHNVRLYINDHWQLALKYGAYGVHLGQDDVPFADMQQLHASGVRLGLSTHGYAEIARALLFRPSYLAIGTLYSSPSKTFAHKPLGLSAFTRLRKLVDVPVVAIGGITVDRAPEVRAAGADGIAVISDLTRASDLTARVEQWRRTLI